MKQLLTIACLLLLAGCAIDPERVYGQEARDAEAHDAFIVFAAQCHARRGIVQIPNHSPTKIRRAPHREDLAFARCVRAGL